MTKPATERDWMTTEEAALELGKSVATLRQPSIAPTVGGYRVGRNWRFTRSVLLASKTKPVEMKQPQAFDTLARQVTDLIALSKQRELEWQFKFQKLERRIASLEKQAGPHALAA